jgi:hypothetical protein
MSKTIKQNNRKPKTRQESITLKTISSFLSKEWNIPFYDKGDSSIVDQISGRRPMTPLVRHAISHGLVKKLRTGSSIGTKIKSSKTIKTDEEIIQSFIDTQNSPVTGKRLRSLLKEAIASYFKDFDYQGVLDLINDSKRLRVLTPGSSYPQLPVPMNGDPLVSEYLYGITHGKDVFMPEFRADYKSLNRGLADGKAILVPKNWKSKRFITLPSRDITDKQYIVFEAFREYVSRRSHFRNHIIQFDDQSVQHELLALPGSCTLDLSSASDRVYLSVISDVWPEFVSNFGDLLPKDILLPNKKVMDIKCIGTQGYPLTFLIMSVITGLIVEMVKVSTHVSSNYGDDVICHQDDFEEVYVALESLGFKINNTKTYQSTDGFVESCGMDLLKLTGFNPIDITPIHLRGISDVDLINFVTRLTDNDMLDYERGFALLDSLSVTYYSFDSEYQSTEFHYPFGDTYRERGFKSKEIYSRDLHRVERSVPYISQEPYKFKGLTEKQTIPLLELIDINESFKDIPLIDSSGNNATLIRIQNHKLYPLYLYLVSNNIHDISYYESFGVDFNTVCAFKLYIGHMYTYRRGSSVYDGQFTNRSARKISVSKQIDELFDIKAKSLSSVFLFRGTLKYKKIAVPTKIGTPVTRDAF